MPFEKSQIDQINKMNASNMARELAIDSYDERSWVGITDAIQSGKYNDAIGEDYVIYKCNIFTDDMLQKFYNIELPRRGEFKDPHIREHAASAPGGKVQGWENNPISASYLGQFFTYASHIKGTGITEVDPMKGSKLSAEGKPVIVLGGGHATLAAPHQRWPLVYRSNLIGRGSDTRMAVGLKPNSGFSFYTIDPKKYKRFKKILSQFESESVMDLFSESGKELRRQLKELK